MKDYQDTIKKICEKAGYGEMWPFAVYEDLADKLVGEYTNADIWLLGFLKSKETLIAVFGEEMVDIDIEQEYWLPAWQYYHNQMGYTLEEVLKYYEEYLGEKE